MYMDRPMDKPCTAEKSLQMRQSVAIHGARPCPYMDGLDSEAAPPGGRRGSYASAAFFGSGEDEPVSPEPDPASELFSVVPSPPSFPAAFREPFP
jgi:hypothetical protein